jgi:ketosteroid isomerase-like protein
MASEERAVTIAKRHIEAWSHHDWQASRDLLTPDVTVTVTTTQPIMKPVTTTGDDAYMEGLRAFAKDVIPGSARVLAANGDARNAMVMVVVESVLGGRDVSLTGARLYLLDEHDRIQSEQVIFYVAEPS